ncbi:MAG: A24 family peptidase [Paracoccaceae bacterium]
MALHLSTLLFPAALLVAAVQDVATRTIPNRLVAALALGFAILAPWAGFDATLLAWHAIAAAAALGLGFGLFAMGWLGGGDGKLMAAIVLWLGPGAVGTFALVTAVAGGALALALLSFRAAPMPALLVQRDWAMTLHRSGGPVPYGVALAIGGLVGFSASPWMAI